MTAPEDERPDEAGGAMARPVQMQRSEQQFGYLLAVALAGVSLASHLSAAVHGHGNAAPLIAVGLAMAAILAAAVGYGQRIITSFTAVIAGFAPLTKSYVGVSFLCLLFGAWLMWKASRAQQRARAAGLAPAPRPRRRERRAGAAGSPEGAAGSAKGRPSANRRYTPPKAKRTAGRRS